ncbi:MAG: ABC transporter ATP-binding protein [Candidatus Thorarchaeota archaeon]
MSTESFSTQSFSKLYGSILALDNLTVTAPSRAVGLLGPNGAGKTTLIRALLGIIRHNQGNGKVLGLDINDSIDEIRDRVGYSPEFAPSIPSVSAMKYVSFMGKLSGLGPVEAAQRAHDTLHYVGLGEERYRKLREFSQGMMQKAKLAAALVHDPDLVILDEPTDGLDPAGRTQMLDLIERLYKEEDKSVIVSSHLLFDVERVCDWVLVLGRGRLVTSGDMSEMLGDTGRALRLRVMGNPKGLLEKLSSRGLEVETDDGNIDITRSDGAEMIILEEVHADPNVSIRYLGRKTRTLEDVFVSVVEGESDLE